MGSFLVPWPDPVLEGSTPTRQSHWYYIAAGLCPRQRFKESVSAGRVQDARSSAWWQKAQGYLDEKRRQNCRELAGRLSRPPRNSSLTAPHNRSQQHRTDRKRHRQAGFTFGQVDTSTYHEGGELTVLRIHSSGRTV